LRACFGVGCPHHHRCGRYAAVVDSQASPQTLGTCLRRDTYPLFVEVADPLASPALALQKRTIRA
jgi:hypothetical protein